MSQEMTKNQSESHLPDGKELYLVTAGGRIRCVRCQARSSRKKQQCGKPALKTSTKGLCNTHGGRPHSLEVLRRISEANTIHGESTKAAKEQYRRDAVLIRQLADVMQVLKMSEGPRMSGRKPAGYKGIYNKEDVIRMFREREVQRN